jgi:ATP/maltotriose-dependent transcriptional regulator MalT
VAYLLAGLAGIARSQAQFERAAIILGNVDSTLSQVAERDTKDNITFYSDVAAVREQLGRTVFAELWAAGKAMPREQCVIYALETPVVPTEQANESETAPSTTPSRSDPLNARELEVLILVARGLSNREIAGQLFLTVNTVKWYLKGIFGKLDAANRTEAVARAQALGLLSQE